MVTGKTLDNQHIPRLHTTNGKKLSVFNLKEPERNQEQTAKVLET